MDNEFFMVICVKVNGQYFLVRGSWPPEILHQPNSIKNLQQIFSEKLQNPDQTIAFSKYGYNITFCKLNYHCTDYVPYKMFGILVEIVFEKNVQHKPSSVRSILDQPSTSGTGAPRKLPCSLLVLVFFL